MSKRSIGVFSGTFDPVHKGHIDFALASKVTSNLDMVYMLPEIMPRSKSGVTHFAHRVSMLRLATRPYRSIDVLELPDKNFTIVHTLPRIRKKFFNDDIVFLLGSDVFNGLSSWPYVKELIRNIGVIVAIRSGGDVASIVSSANKLPSPLREFHIIESRKPKVSSSKIRHELLNGNMAQEELLPSVRDYIKKHWLYSSFSIS